MFRNNNKNINDYIKQQFISTSNMILIASIINTIENSKIFLFIENDKLNYDSSTISPWIYLEITTANHVQFSCKKSFFKKRNLLPEIRFKLENSNFKSVESVEELVLLIKSTINVN